MSEPKQVSSHVLQHHLTLLERFAREAREALCLSSHLNQVAQTPSLQIARPLDMHLANGHAAAATAPSRQDQAAQGAAEMSFVANAALSNIVEHSKAILLALGISGGPVNGQGPKLSRD